MYTGGAEHSVLHLLYSRFVMMALNDWGYFSSDGKPASGWEEPFPNFFAHGLVIKDGAKMSKSKGNVVNPDEYIAKYGADALRLYLMFMGPLSEGGDFRDTGMEGMVRWLGKVWRLIEKSAKAPKAHYSDEQKSIIYKELQKIVIKVSDDMPKRRYNTAIAGLMEFINCVSDQGGILPPDVAKKFLQLLAPFAPFVTEELWQKLHDRETLSDKKDSIHFSAWPVGDTDALKDEKIPFVIQVNGKVREIQSVTPSESIIESKMIELAKGSSKISALIEKQTIRKTIFVQGKLINFVV
jgi:leucyl-tRNA synthetase